MTAVNTTKKAMDDLDIVFNTNGIIGRSNNSGSVNSFKSFVANVLEYVPIVPLNETIYYNVGYLNYTPKHQILKKDYWGYINPLNSKVDKDFSCTAAHELGHSILKAFAEYGGGSTDYSYKHKGSSDYSSAKPVNEGGENYPLKGEIDLMKYYNNDPYWYDFDRIVACQDDILGLIWLTKLKITQ